MITYTNGWSQWFTHDDAQLNYPNYKNAHEELSTVYIGDPPAAFKAKQEGIIILYSWRCPIEYAEDIKAWKQPYPRSEWEARLISRNKK